MYINYCSEFLSSVSKEDLAPGVDAAASLDAGEFGRSVLGVRYSHRAPVTEYSVSLAASIESIFPRVCTRRHVGTSRRTAPVINVVHHVYQCRASCVTCEVVLQLRCPSAPAAARLHFQLFTKYNPPGLAL